ncbi:MAG: MBL fold metallo-hydrolase [Gammaproteobacteria bacterium]|nr:MBL fold metallo-hydrolase [Gammaproteobacteria bacterium]
MKYSTRFAAVLGLVAATAASAQQNFDAVEIKIVPVRDGIYMLMGSGGNIGVSVGADKTFIIDDQYGPLSPKIAAAVAKLSSRPIDFLLNTHWHGDHTGGNENFGNAGVLIFAQDNVRGRMATMSSLRGEPRELSPASALPVVTYGEDITLHINGQTIHGVHGVPAHTDGDTIVKFEQANVIHTGDLFMPGRYPFTDSESGGDFDGFIKNAETIMAMADDDTLIIPGHGELARKADVKLYHDTLATLRERVAALVKRGRTRDQVIAAKPMADLDGTWGSGFMKPDDVLGAAYDAVSRNR